MVEREASAVGLQQFSVKGRVLAEDDPQLQDALALLHETPERPRCLCVPGGVEMYVAHHRRFLVKRMPETGNKHAPACTSYEPEAHQSGLGELLGEAVLEQEPGKVELRVDFPWARTTQHGVTRGEPQDVMDVATPGHRMSLRALMHFLFERAGFNRWSPAMQGKRNQGVLHKYLLEAAEDVSVKGVALRDRLYIPEPFNEATRADAAKRRRETLSVLRPRDGHRPLAIVIGEFKDSEATALGRRIWIRHMPDAPLLITVKTWKRIERVFAPLFEARDADVGLKVRLMMAALVGARREHTYEVDAASLMLTDEHWIPVEGIHELPLLHELVEQRRRFLKPLRYDARSAAGFANVLLLDTGAAAVPLHVVSAFMKPNDRLTKERAMANFGAGAWVWVTDDQMPSFPKAEVS